MNWEKLCDYDGNLVERAVKIVQDFYESENIYESTDAIKERAEQWAMFSNIMDSQTLAAVTIYGEYTSALRDSQIKQIKEFYFPSEILFVNIYN